MQIKIDEAPFNDLIAAAKHLGLDATYGRTSADDLRRMLRDAAMGGDTVEIVDDDGGTRVQTAAPRIAGFDATDYRNDPKVVITINPDKESYGTRHVPIGANGDTILVKPGVKVAIPYRHYEVLQNAVEHVMSQESDPLTGRPITIESPRQSVSFSVMEMPSHSEIAAWFERTKDIKSGDRRKAA